VNLITQVPVPVISPTAQVVDVKSAPYNITTDRTQYICTYHALPSDKKYHVVIAEPLIEVRLMKIFCP